MFSMQSVEKGEIVVCSFLEFGTVSKWCINPLPDDKILDRSELKQSADDNFEFDENSRKFSEGVENTVGKGEIAHYEQFLLFPQCFQKACFPGASKGAIVWEWVKEWVNPNCQKIIEIHLRMDKKNCVQRAKKWLVEFSIMLSCSFYSSIIKTHN